MDKNYNNLRIKTVGGYTVLFAVLVSSLILAVGVGIMSITLKEITLSIAGRESQFAFYAADSGLECARYWEFNYAQPFAFPQAPIPLDPPNTSIDCWGVEDIDVDIHYDPGTEVMTYDFQVDYEEDPIYCSKVKIEKNIKVDEDDPTLVLGENIRYTAIGINTPCDNLSNRQQFVRSYIIEAGEFD
jgi:hypothetical protein